MKGFYHIWAWRPSWSCDLDFLYTHWFPLPIDASYKIWLWLARRFQRRRYLKLWTDGQTDDGRTPDHGHPISSPCEPNGSGELINYLAHEHNTAIIGSSTCLALVFSALPLSHFKQCGKPNIRKIQNVNQISSSTKTRTIFKSSQNLFSAAGRFQFCARQKLILQVSAFN